LIPTRTTIQNITKRARLELKEIPGRAVTDAQLLLAHVLGQSRTWITTHPEVELDPREESDYLSLLKRYRSGEPLPYILGWWEFYGRRFTLNDSVLIPRPETEHIVELALRFLLAQPTKRVGLDVGTGSGCIAITLLAEVGDLQITATDISYQALRLARKNGTDMKVGNRLHLAQMHLATAVESRFDLICANLPYIPARSLKNLKVARNEPLVALNGGEDGLLFISELLKELPRLLLPGGYALIEMEAGTSGKVLELARHCLVKADFRLFQDLAGHDRVLAIEY
jgi:release factor glutamine methyltransferase